MSQFVFAAGQMWGKPVGVGKTPVLFGILQGVSLDISFTTRAHYGQKVFPILISRGHASISGQAEFAAINARLYSDILFGGYQNGPVLGATRTENAEVHIVTSQAITVNNAATFMRDLGVVRQVNGDIYEKVLTGPLDRQYACNETTGVYSFGIEAENRAMCVSYNWADAANGKQVYLTNQTQAAAPAFTIVFTETFNGKAFTVALNSCVAERLTVQNKLQDFVLPSFSFRAQADANGVLGTMSFDEDSVGWIVSSIYPLSFADTFNASATFVSGRFMVPPQDQFNAAVALTGGILSDGLRTYNNGLPESFNSIVTWTGGNLANGLQTYSNWPPESFNSSVTFVSGNLANGLQTYSNWPPESFNASVTFTGGTLS